MVTGDKKWIVFNNVQRKRSWCNRDKPSQTTSKAGIHQSKILLSVWLDFKSIVYFDLLPRNKTINTEVYCLQLDELNDAEATRTC